MGQFILKEKSNERKRNHSGKGRAHEGACHILQKKLALASKLIDEGVPRTVAAMQVGYENYSNFYRLYRKNFEKN